MGMDVYGKKAKNEKGRYFRNNVWWWRRLWDFTCNAAGIDNDLKQKGHYNSGDGLNSRDSLKAAKALRTALADGSVDKYEQGLAEAIKNAPDETCSACNGTGRREVNGQKGKCYGCDGTGHTRPFWTEYHFSKENVEEFATFLENCGGFKIW